MKSTAVIAFVGLTLQAGVVFAQSAQRSPVPVVEGTPAGVEVQQSAASAPVSSSSPVRSASGPSYGPSSAQAQPVQSQNAELLMLLDQLQEEVRYLRGQLEEQSHQMNKMREDQRDRYRDLDRRITRLSSEASTSAASQPLVVAPVPTAASGAAETNAAAPSAQQSPLDAGMKPPAVSATPAPRLSDREAYQQAWSLVRSKSFPEALTALDNFRKWYPASPLLPNTLYWSAEVCRAQDQPDQLKALEYYTQLIERFPEHNKTADAYYKLGLTYHDLGEQDKALTVMKKVVDLYAGQAPANLAQQYISKWSR